MGFRKRIALRRSIAAVLGEGTVLPGADGGETRPLIRTAFAAFIHTASSRERQSHVVGPDGDPSLPDDTGANRACRRRILLRFKSALEKRPSRTGRAELKRGAERGDAYPHHEMFRATCARYSLLSFRGAHFLREPGIHRDGKMDSGPAPSGASRNDGWRNCFARNNDRDCRSCDLLCARCPMRVFGDGADDGRPHRDRQRVSHAVD